MAYSELIKNYDRIRDYMRQFYVYGFKSRSEYDKKSARSYDNERRRMESWLGEFMRFRQRGDGKNVFMSVDSRSISGNPFYNVFKAKSFTTGDVTFHFYIMDLLRDGRRCTAGEIVELLCDRYLNRFPDVWQPDISTVRKKLKEYEAQGLLRSEKRGRELVYFRREEDAPLEGWADTLSFFSEMDPLGVIGSTLLDKLPEKPDYYQFKHHYMLHAIDSQILLQLLSAIGDRRSLRIDNLGHRSAVPAQHRICPLKIYVSTQGGRQYLLCYHYRFRKLMFFRLDRIQKVTLLEKEPRFPQYLAAYEEFRRHIWGTSTGEEFSLEHLEMTVRFGADEQYILKRLEREKRGGTVTLLDECTCRYTADVYDAAEMLPWIRTFIGRIEKLECSNPEVVRKFYEDLERMYAMYGGDEDAVS